MKQGYIDFREIDRVGRIGIPMPIRKACCINAGDLMKISYEDGKVIISKSEKNCVFCSSTDNLVEFEGRPVCRDCVKKLAGRFPD